MAGDLQDPRTVLADALEAAQPDHLLNLQDYVRSLEGIERLRDALRGQQVHARVHPLIAQWMLGDRTDVAEVATAVVLVLEDLHAIGGIIMEVANRFEGGALPFVLSYDVGEHEFRIECGPAERVLGHYGRDVPEVDRCLHALERLYRKLHPSHVIPYFRT
jgi:hypothetical protein